MQPEEVVNVGMVIIEKEAVAIVTKVIINEEVAAVAAINAIH